MSIRSFRRARGRRLEREARRASILARRGRLLAGTTLTATALMAANAQAASNTYIVQSSADTTGGTCNPSPGTCDTLPDAINAADSDSGNSDTITFASPLSGGQTITVSNPLYLDNSAGMTISGGGAVTISGGGSSQIFNVDPDLLPDTSTAQFALKGLTMTHGDASSEPGGAIEDFGFTGPAPALQVPLSLSNDVVSDSSSNEIGGGIATTAPLTLSHTTVTGNDAERGGGIAAYPAEYHEGKYGNLVSLVSHTVVSHNHATGAGGGISPYAGGGGILAAGDALFISSSTVTGNSGVSGGGVALASKYGATITRSTISGNDALVGGGLELYGFTTSSPYSTHKYSPDDVFATTISGNHAKDGGGVGVFRMAPGSPVTINSSTIARNTGAEFGGGMDVTGQVAAPFQLVDSTITGNAANHGGGVSLGDSYNSPLTISNPSNGQRGSISLDNSTIAQNTARSTGGGIFLSHYTAQGGSTQRSGNATLISTIVAGNRAAKKPNDLARAAQSTAGGFTAEFSLIQNPGTVPVAKQSVITGQNPMLGALANNGGPTQTMRPGKSSPVVDAGHNSLGLAYDQIGNPRTIDTSKPNPPGGDGTDIGAVELTAKQVGAAMVRPQSFGVTVNGKRLRRGSTPTLVAGKTRVGCELRIGQLSSCVIEARVDGYLVAAGGLRAKHPASRLSTTVRSNKVVERYLKAHFKHGIKARIYAVSDGGLFTSAVGTVRVLP